MKLLFCGSGWLDLVGAIRARLPGGWSIDIARRDVPVREQVADVQVILPSNWGAWGANGVAARPSDAGANAEVIEAAKGLLLIQQPAVGFDGIDLEAARARGIPVCNAPGLNADSVAQAALLLILALARRWNAARTAFDRRQIGTPLGVELGGKVLGIVGLGRSGERLGGYARGLGMDVRSVRSSSRREELMELLAASDFVSIHCPLTPRTRGLFDRETISAMKPGAMLINCARGPIVERGALEDALASGHLGGAGLDVFWAEPWDPRDPLFLREDVVALPHVAGATAEAFGRIADLVVDNSMRVSRGEAPKFRVA